MLRFWRNPEFVRHFRAELRAPRAFTTAVLVLVICALVALSCWASQPKASREFFRLFHYWLVGIQYVVFGLWCVYACGQAISGERALKTYDFLRATRLTSGEIMVGKALGTPILAYFIVGCSLPIAVVTGIMGGIPLWALVRVYLLMLVFGLFISLVSLWVSMLAEQAAGRFAWIFLLWLWLGPMLTVGAGPFPGVASLTLFPSVLSLYGVSTDFARGTPTFFGLPVSFAFLTVLLYVLLGAWVVLMLVRNLKREREQVRLLSRWQAVGFAAFLNVLFYALLDPKRVGTGTGFGRLKPHELSVLAVVFNAVILFAIGLATLTPHEKLKAWWRRRAAREEAYLSEHGLPWPWLVPAALIAYALLVAEAFGLRRTVPIQSWRLEAAAVELLVFLVFTTRDVLFLQWCALTRMKRPLVKGFLYLCLYYTADTIVAVVAQVINSSWTAYVAALTPAYALTVSSESTFYSASGTPAAPTLAAPAIYIGLAIQIPLIFLLLSKISKRLARPAVTAPAPAVASV